LQNNNQQFFRPSRRFPSGDVDILVIGGGIVGAGIARDAALRSLKCLLVEQNDFASGTSSRSSRLLHGGIRYLEQWHIGLVREASTEKMVIRHIAPHLATPLPFIFPTHQHGPWKLWKLRIGVKIYDLLCGHANLGRSSSFNRERILALLPMLNPSDLTGAVRYFDGMTNDARLVLDTLRSAASAGASLLNYASFANSVREGDHWKCEIHDQLTGDVASINTRCVVNATGAWGMRFPASRLKLRLTKGVHLVVDRSRLPLEDAVVMSEGSRILFAIPWGKRTILGTTDTDYDGPLDALVCNANDAKYVLGVVNATFPSAAITEADVISTWTGLRPLIADPHGKPSDISRKHLIEMTEPGWFDVAGGKLTIYRLMAEQTIDQMVRHAGLRARSCTTATTPLLVGDAKFSGILPPTVSKEAVEHFCRHEWAIHLSDVMIRRTSWRHYHRHHMEIAEQVTRWMAEFLAWDHETAQKELVDYQSETCCPIANV
jgi:glycerol-3-phosphate dehydrogenase